MKIITIMQSKGGVSKSTIATQLAASLARDYKTVLVDTDRGNKTARKWYNKRVAQGIEGDLKLLVCDSAKSLRSDLASCGDVYEYAVVDTKPEIDAIHHFLMAESDLVITPITLNENDLESQDELLDALASNGTHFRVVLSRVDKTKAIHKNLLNEIQALNSDEVLPTVFYERADILKTASGRFIDEIKPYGDAHTIVHALNNDILKALEH